MAGHVQQQNLERGYRIELVISAILLAGVLVSAVLVGIGLVILFTGHSASLENSKTYHHITAVTYPFPHTVPSIRQAVQAGSGQGYIMLGLVVLVLTPIVRVMTSVFLFAYERDGPMALITLFVLIVLISSYFIGIAT